MFTPGLTQRLIKQNTKMNGRNLLKMGGKKIGGGISKRVRVVMMMIAYYVYAQLHKEQIY